MTSKQSVFENLLSLDGKVAIITGAASGIGRATAKLLADVGAAVALIDIDESGGKETAANINDSGGKSQFFHCNVISDFDCRSVVEDIHTHFGRIDTLFNNAGLIHRKSVVELEEPEWDLELDVNLKAIFFLSRYVIPKMIRNGGGSIINCGSGWGLKGGPKAAAYCAAKGGVANLTRAMAIDHGRKGIRVNCVCPGDIDTPLLRGEAHQLGINEEDFMQEAADRPINRVGTPEDVAKAVLFLASDLSTWVTGTHIVVDGGRLA
ncbi:MAG: glucose 1-dehydrogenase [Desulfobacterales bacterium]|nr:MAG: glucose 1-dehydrogenase [Desulfobacterales bacterium]